MDYINSARLIIYRMHEKGLEIFLVNTGLVNEDEYWGFPDAVIQQQDVEIDLVKLINLEPVECEDGNLLLGVAIEGDWHDIPRIRSLVKHDMEFVKSKLKKAIPEIERGTFFAVKEAFKKLLPQEYQLLKELKDIITEKNLVKSI